MDDKRPTLPALTGLRFFAALWVVFDHGSTWWRPGLITGRAGILAAYGQLAVYLFFALSGFILVYSYDRPGGGMRGTARRYYVGRVARVYPVYALGLVLGLGPYLRWGGDLPGAVCQNTDPSSTVLGTLALVQSWVPSGICLDSPAWSLSVEAAFYISFPLWVLLACRLATRHLLVLLPALWLSYVMLVQTAGGTRSSLFFLPVFLVGLVLGRIVLLHPQVPRPVGLAGPPLAVLGVGWLGAHAGDGIPQEAALLLPLYLLLIYSLVPAIGLGRLLARPALVALGEASYGLYILHWPLLEWLTHATGRVFGTPAGADPGAWLLFALYLAAAILVSLLTYRAVERPAQMAIRALLSPARRPTPAAEIAPAAKVAPGSAASPPEALRPGFAPP